MARNRLRIFHGPESLAAPHAADFVDQPVRVPFGEIAPLLADAVASRRTWLRDFEHEEVTISNDLYEVLLAYQHCRRTTT